MRRHVLTGLLVAALFVLTALPTLAEGNNRQASESKTYHQTNLVSDLPGLAAVTDPHLVNPWGIATSPTSPFWVADNGTGLATLYNTAGQPLSLVVTIPPPAGSPPGTVSAPTGTVFNGTGAFSVSEKGKSGTALFLFATEDGTIAGWNPTVDLTHAVLAVDKSGSGAVYKGLALASSGSPPQPQLYATNFRAGTVDVFDASFHAVLKPGAFQDPRLPAGFAPFGIRLLGGKLFVTYAKQDAAKHDDVAGPGNGFVDVFDPAGRLLERFARRGRLNSPWGLAVAPADFGRFSNAILVGNFGDGRINVFSAEGEFRGQLRNEQHRPITIDGLWGLLVGNGAAGGATNAVYFTAGIDGEAHGLFGSLTVVPERDEDGDQ